MQRFTHSLRAQTLRSRKAAWGALGGLALAAVLALAQPANAQRYLDGGGAGSRPDAGFDDPTGGYLDGGGPVRRGGTVTNRRDQGFLSGGGSIRDIPDVGTVDSGGFLDDGGSIRTTPDIGFGTRDREFLDGAGSIQSRPRVLIDGALRPSGAVSIVQRPNVVYRTEGSFTRISTEGRDGRSFERPSGRPGAARGGSSGTSPKFIDVERERLDRRPSSGSGVTVFASSTGGPKIIRIDQGYEAADTHHESSLGERRVAAAERQAKPGEPWTPEWLSRCTQRYRSFDPNFGTYVNADGHSRFCQP